jgi:hypothetical protein
MKATPEQREAVKHVEAFPESFMAKTAFGTLAAAWAAEHPDDDEELATWDWLRDVMGWVYWGAALRSPVGARELQAWRDSQGEVSIGVWSSGTRIPFLFSPKRRQVRLLVESLGSIP